MEEGKKNRSRLFYISFLQVIGPLLVILGHSTNGMPQNDILQVFKSWIYTFHMPLFSLYLVIYLVIIMDLTKTIKNL